MANNSGNISVEKQQSLRASTEVKKALEQVNSLSTKTSLKPAETPVHYTASSHSPQGELDGLYIISVAARILRMHPQTLRKYEKEFIAEFETLSESNKKAVLEKSRIANQILATNSRSD